MEKIWFIEIDGKKEGPYSKGDLRRHPRLTPDTLVWKKGFPAWVPLRKVLELRDLLESAEPEEERGENKDRQKGAIRGDEDGTLALRYEPPMFYFWILIAIVIVLFTLYQLFYASP